MELRQQDCEAIFDEAMYIATASEGAVSLESALNFPIFLRKKYLKQYRKMIEERKQSLEAKSGKVAKRK